MSLEARLHRLEEETRRLGIRRPDPDDDLDGRIIRALTLAQIDMSNGVIEHTVQRLLEARPAATEAQARAFLWKRVFFARLRQSRVTIPQSVEADVWQRTSEVRARMISEPRLAARLHHRGESHTIVLSDEWALARRCG